MLLKSTSFSMQLFKNVPKYAPCLMTAFPMAQALWAVSMN